MLLGSGIIVDAQDATVRVELATRLTDGQAIVQVRVPRGQTIDTAELTPNAQDSLPMTVEPVALPVTQWLLVDASSEMVNLETATQTAMQRLLSSSSLRTGVIFFDDELRVLAPTENSEQIDAFVASYTATPDSDGCVADALTQVAEADRPLDRAWHILLVTSSVSSQADCTSQELPQMPAPVDVISLSMDSEETLDDLIARSGGSLVSANLRTLEARFNEIRIQWGQPIFQLQAEGLTSPPIRATLDLTLSNGQQVSEPVRFRTYNLIVPETPTAAPTDTIAAAPSPEAQPTTNADSQPTAVPASETATADAEQDMSLLLVVGTILFVVGAIAFSIGLSRAGRGNSSTARPAKSPTTDSSSSFYAALEETPAPVAPDETVTRQRRDADDVSVTQVAPNTVASSTPVMGTQEEQEYDAMTEDNLIVTQVLSDERFRKMIVQSQHDQEVIGFVRVEGKADGDYRLTRRGLMIGRGMGCDIQITGDSAISRQHARIDVQDGDMVTVSRLSATNPVVVGGVQVSNRHPLKPNDVVHLSDQTRLVFVANQPDAAELDADSE